MNDFLAPVLAASLFAIWIFIAWQVGLRAAKKHRRHWLWTLMTIFPLGPIVAPLWLATMPTARESASTGQIVGRAVLITLLALSQAVRIAQEVFTISAGENAGMVDSTSAAQRCASDSKGANIC
jgi:hypothetical protein